MRLNRLFVSLSGAVALGSCSMPEPVTPPSAIATAQTRSVNQTQMLSVVSSFFQQTQGRFTRLEKPLNHIGRGIGAHQDFCRRYPYECDSNPFEPSYVPVTKTVMDLLKAVNTDVNRRMRPMLDNDNYGDDFWNIPAEDENGMMRGDCDDYTMTKRSILSNFIPKASMSVAYVHVYREGVYWQSHAVLVVRMLGGEMVLDNLTDELKTPQETGYKFIAMTDPQDQRQWRHVSLQDAHDPAGMPVSYHMASIKYESASPPYIDPRRQVTDLDIKIIKTLSDNPRFERLREAVRPPYPELFLAMR